MMPVRALLRLVRFTTLYFSLCVLFSLVIYVAVPVVLGLATQSFFDSVTRDHAGLSVWIAIGLVVAAQTGESIAGPLFGTPWSSMQQKAQVLLRRNLFAGILEGYGRYGLTEPAGEIINRSDQDPLLIADVLDAFADLIGRTIFAVVAAVLLWQIDHLLTVVLFVPLVLSSLVTYGLSNRIRKYRLAARESSGRVSAYLGDLLAGVLALKVAGAGTRAVQRLEVLGHQRRRMEVRDSVFSAMLDAFDLNVSNLGAGVVLLLAAQAMRTGSFTVGDLALFVVFLDALTWFPDEISRFIGGLKQIEVSMDRLESVVPGVPPGSLSIPAPVYLGAERSPVPPPPAPIALERLEVTGLTYRHPETGAGIVDVSFVLERGSLTVISGPLGSGKTTLLQVLLGLLPRDGGQIFWNGEPIDDPATFLVPPRCAYTPQVPRLFSETVRENILLGRPATQQDIDGAVRAAVLEPDVDAFDHGLDTLVGARGLRLSGGQVQRVAAARMFVRDAELMVFDDLCSALDAQTESELWHRLLSRDTGQTCLVVSHRPVVLGAADQVLVMEGGHVRRA